MRGGRGPGFDLVIVPGANDRNDRADMDRSLLYVACTRAMHRLAVTFSGTLTPLVGGESQ